MLVVTIEQGKLSTRQTLGRLEDLQDIVGGYVEPAFTIESPEGNGCITGYVNEEGLMIGLPLAMGIFHSPEYCVPLAGSMVICGLTDEGETRGLSAKEAERVERAYRPAPMGLCPVIEGDMGGRNIPMVPVRGILSLPIMAKA